MQSWDGLPGTTGRPINYCDKLICLLTGGLSSTEVFLFLVITDPSVQSFQGSAI